ncbi:toll/interleukin-1 receptor domain-containing protein [Streptomyces sp. NRRL F-4489]|uniref:toll/interleukin-1 receptor domain-containing protein n=1 Tax=Streptomyces sp. NRRL F-4489 TaxID=1609095 RepID=UPI0008366740|nr:toll/interleukin-1 receptor domain-containing protein [Streptomyces sp. NRRL F-4489]
MPLIFVNYRTGDEEATATLVERELSRRFGDKNVFRASKSIGMGSSFPKELITAVRRSSVLLAVIGPRWLEARSAGGRTALEDPDDWTRREILEAFESGAVVIPLLVGRTERLRPEALQPALGDLADCQYRRFDHRNAEADLDRLAEDLAFLVPELAEAEESRRRGAAEAQAGEDAASERSGQTRMHANVIKHRQRGGIGNLNGDFSGTFVSEPTGPVHTGSGHLYQSSDRYLAPRFSGDGMRVDYAEGGAAAENRRDRLRRKDRPADGEQ